MAGGALLLGSTLLDRDVRALVPEGGGERYEGALTALNALGNPRYAVPVLGGTYAAGRLARAPGVARGAAHTALGLLAAGVANGAVKYAVGRERPAGGDPSSFRPFTPRNEWQSFPSGHALVSFALASGLAVETRAPVVAAAGYSAATLVAWSRVYRDKHWLSDVVGGALIGAAASHATLAVLHRRATPPSAVEHLAIVPRAGGGVMVVGGF